MSRIKTCVACGNPFFGRRDAKTCGMRCRKALQRMRDATGSMGESKTHTPGGFSRHSASGTSAGSRPSSARRRLRNQMIALISAGLLLALNLSGSAFAAVSQGYISNDAELRQYMAVRVAGDDDKGHPVVESSSLVEQDKTIGIAVGLNDSLVTVAPESSEVYVVSSGTAQAYISDVNGAVKKGDLLAVSPLRGILMKSTDATKPTVGQALEDFINKPTQTIIAKDSEDKSVEVHIAVMNMNVSLKPAKLVSSKEDDNWIKSLGNSLVGHEISTARIVAALAIFFILMVIEGELIYGTVASTITAIGRNPLAKKSILSQSFKSVKIASAILIMGIVSVGLILWL